MTLYFNSMALGGSGNGDYSNFINFWQDAGNTVPNLAVPTSTDDVFLMDTPVTGSGVSQNLIESGGPHPVSASITIYGTATGITFQNGTFSAPSGTLPASGCVFNTAIISAVNAGGGCTYNVSITTLTDDGSGNIAISSWSGSTLTWNGSLNFNVTYGSASVTASSIVQGTFSGAVIAGSITGGTFSGITTASTVISGDFTGTTIATSSFSGNMNGGTLATKNFGGSLTGGTVTLKFGDVVWNPGSVTGGSASLYTAGGADAITSVTIAPFAQTVSFPVASKVLSSAPPYGVSGSQTGTASSGGGGAHIIGSGLCVI